MHFNFAMTHILIIDKKKVMILNYKAKKRGRNYEIRKKNK